MLWQNQVVCPMYSVAAEERIRTTNALVYLDTHSPFVPVILISLFTYTLISLLFTCIYEQLEWATCYEFVMKNR